MGRPDEEPTGTHAQPAPEPACLVIADISGYTSYLAGVELDHAQDILADLMDTVVGSLRPTFRLAKLEGDAAFCYAMTETVDGSALHGHRRPDLLRVPATAARYRPGLDMRLQRLHPHARASTSRSSPTTAPIATQRIAGRDELVGSE